MQLEVIFMDFGIKLNNTQMDHQLQMTYAQSVIQWDKVETILPIRMFVLV